MSSRTSVRARSRLRERAVVVRGALRGLTQLGRLQLSRGSLAFTHDLHIGELLEWAARAHRARLFIERGQECVSFAAMNRRANRIARGLERAGVRAGQGVAVQLRDPLRALEALFALHKLGAFLVPLDPALRGGPLCRILNDSQVVAVLLDHTTAQDVSAIREHLAGAELRLVSTLAAPADYRVPEGMRDYASLLGESIADGDDLERRVDRNAPSFITYAFERDTTPRPSPVAFGAQGLEALAPFASALYRPDDRVYVALPSFEHSGLVLSVLCALWAGIPLLLDPSPPALDPLREAAARQATCVLLTAAQLQTLLAAPPTEADRTHARAPMRVVCTPSDPAPASDVSAAFARRFGVEVCNTPPALAPGLLGTTRALHALHALLR